MSKFIDIIRMSESRLYYCHTSNYLNKRCFKIVKRLTRLDKRIEMAPNHLDSVFFLEDKFSYFSNLKRMISTHNKEFCEKNDLDLPNLQIKKKNPHIFTTSSSMQLKY